jgi:hypothetical protein
MIEYEKYKQLEKELNATQKELKTARELLKHEMTSYRDYSETNEKELRRLKATVDNLNKVCSLMSDSSKLEKQKIEEPEERKIENFYSSISEKRSEDKDEEEDEIENFLENEEDEEEEDEIESFSENEEDEEEDEFAENERVVECSYC